jgi:hypothetical protein
LLYSSDRHLETMAVEMHNKTGDGPLSANGSHFLAVRDRPLADLPATRSLVAGIHLLTTLVSGKEGALGVILLVLYHSIVG